MHGVSVEEDVGAIENCVHFLGDGKVGDGNLIGKDV